MNKYELSQIKQHRELIDKLDIAICALYDAENTSLAEKMTDFDLPFDKSTSYTSLLSAMAQELLDIEIKIIHNLEKWELSAIKKMRR